MSGLEINFLTPVLFCSHVLSLMLLKRDKAVERRVLHLKKIISKNHPAR